MYGQGSGVYADLSSFRFCTYKHPAPLDFCSPRQSYYHALTPEWAGRARPLNTFYSFETASFSIAITRGTEAADCVSVILLYSAIFLFSPESKTPQASDTWESASTCSNKTRLESISGLLC